MNYYDSKETAAFTFEMPKGESFSLPKSGSSVSLLVKRSWRVWLRWLLTGTIFYKGLPPNKEMWHCSGVDVIRATVNLIKHPTIKL